MRKTINNLKSESGYSLPEVMVSIIILAIAIIPMVGMFDAGLRAAVVGSNYDKGRALAKKQLEIAQSLPYGTVKTNLPNAPCTFDSTGLCVSADRTDSDAQFSNFRYTIRKQYVTLNVAGTEFVASDRDRGLMRVTVTVGWGGASFNETQYTTDSLKAR